MLRLYIAFSPYIDFLPLLFHSQYRRSVKIIWITSQNHQRQHIQSITLHTVFGNTTIEMASEATTLALAAAMYFRLVIMAFEAQFVEVASALPAPFNGIGLFFKKLFIIAKVLEDLLVENYQDDNSLSVFVVNVLLMLSLLVLIPIARGIWHHLMQSLTAILAMVDLIITIDAMLVFGVTWAHSTRGSEKIADVRIVILTDHPVGGLSNFLQNVHRIGVRRLTTIMVPIAQSAYEGLFGKPTLLVDVLGRVIVWVNRILLGVLFPSVDVIGLHEREDRAQIPPALG